MRKTTKTTKPTVASKIAATKARVFANAKKVEKNNAAKAKRTQPNWGPKVKLGMITEVKPAASGGAYTIVATGKPGEAGHKAIQIPQSHMTGELAKLATIGGMLKAVEKYLADHKPHAKLAAGVTGNNAPNAALAAAQQRKGKPTPAAPVAKVAVPAKARKPAAAPKGTDRPYKVLAKQHDRRPGTWTDYMLNCALTHTSTAKADAACAASDYGKAGKRMDWKWIEAKGYIAF